MFVLKPSSQLSLASSLEMEMLSLSLHRLTAAGSRWSSGLLRKEVKGTRKRRILRKSRFQPQEIWSVVCLWLSLLPLYLFI